MRIDWIEARGQQHMGAPSSECQ